MYRQLCVIYEPVDVWFTRLGIWHRTPFSKLIITTISPRMSIPLSLTPLITLSRHLSQCFSTHVVSINITWRIMPALNDRPGFGLFKQRWRSPFLKTNSLRFKATPSAVIYSLITSQSNPRNRHQYRNKSEDLSSRFAAIFRRVRTRYSDVFLCGHGVVISRWLCC